MTEAEILQLSFSANEAVASLFSIFFGMVSAYIAGLFFFINRAPATIKVIAFTLLTMGFLFIGQAMAGIEIRILGLVQAWTDLKQTATGITQLNNPILPIPVRDMLDGYGVQVASYEGNRLGIYSGWFLSMLVYLALFYATFIYRWPVRHD
ncbi:MAG: hypothetical protein ACR2PI_07050 [Hyphomicrobiaceae bacterium]